MGESGQNIPMWSSESEHDRDYIGKDDSGDEILDHIIIKESIKANVEWLGSREKKKDDGDSSKSS